ncbi:MAG TPA: hypothetical protein VEA16_06440 [Vicinamibacterales bacterium]|nr:hypothetical protein [Vicinamibacterales bacterium]
MSTQATAIASGTGDAQAITAVAGTILLGFSITENAGTPAAARVRLHLGTDNTGTELFDVTLAASESVREWFGASGPDISTGLYMDRVSGTTRLTIYTRRF